MSWAEALVIIVGMICGTLIIASLVERSKYER